MAAFETPLKAPVKFKAFYSVYPRQDMPPTCQKAIYNINSELKQQFQIKGKLASINSKVGELITEK